MGEQNDGKYPEVCHIWLACEGVGGGRSALKGRANHCLCCPGQLNDLLCYVLVHVLALRECVCWGRGGGEEG